MNGQSTASCRERQVVVQHQCRVVVTQDHGGVGGAHCAAQAQTTWCSSHQATIKGQAVVDIIAQRQAARVQEAGGPTHARAATHQSQVVSVGRGGQCSGAQVVGKADGLPCCGVAQHHRSVRFQRCLEGGTVAVRQCQCFQSLDVANGVSEQHSAARPRIQHHRLGVLTNTVERLGEGDVGTGCQCAIVGGVKRGGGRSDHGIVGNEDGVGAAGSHQTSAEGAAARGIGFKVCWSADAANRTAINR